MVADGAKSPLWQCPKCGHRFVTRNLWHSCGHYRLAEHFRGKPKVLRETFDRFVALAKACGPVTVYAQKTRIVIQRRIESFGRLGCGHHLRLQQPNDIDEPLANLMREAYSIGQQNPTSAFKPRR